MPDTNTKSNFKYSPLLWLLILAIAIAILTAIGPAEKTLGVNARVVYLHGVWVWTAMASFVLAALVGAVGLVTRRVGLNAWSRTLGRTGLILWLTYLPVSMWAMQTNWNGLFLAEPRWRFAVIFAIGGIILQIGVSLIENPAWASGANILYILTMFLALSQTENVMHPPSPILSSRAPSIQAHYTALLITMILAMSQLARLVHRLERGKSSPKQT